MTHTPDETSATRWRVVGTDTENDTGVAPACEADTHPADRDSWVFDCCPSPQIECWTPHAARQIAGALNAAESEYI